MKDYYYILGVSQNTSAVTIKQAYKKLALKYHPDQNPDDMYAVEKMKELNEAYSVLSNPIKRAEYNYKLTIQIKTAQTQRSNYSNYHHQRQRKRGTPNIITVVLYLIMLFFLGLCAFDYDKDDTKSIQTPDFKYQDSKTLINVNYASN